MKRVTLCSPYKGNVARNVAYGRACLLDCLMRGEAPFAPHLLYTQPGVLDDSLADHRKLGMQAGAAWNHVAVPLAVYTDLGISDGMKVEIKNAIEIKQVIDWRSLGAPWCACMESPQ